MKPAVAPPMSPEEQARHVEMVKAVTAKTNEQMRPTQELYDERCRLWRMSCDVPLRDLRRLNGILAKLSHDDLKRVAAFAEGLAEWSDSGSESPDASGTQG